MTNQERKQAIVCERCGSSCENGYSERSYGRRDPETGYQDTEIFCTECENEEGCYEAADMNLTMRMEGYDE
jgi:hypothetical protein